jgi:hypothetical protein
MGIEDILWRFWEAPLMPDIVTGSLSGIVGILEI